jgi:polygalacturonase
MHIPLRHLIPAWCVPSLVACSRSADGFDPDSTSDVLLEDSFFHTDDDAIAIKAGWDCAGLDVGVPSDNITLRNITVYKVPVTRIDPRHHNMT